MSKACPWETESALVADFCAWVETLATRRHEPTKWLVYPETAGWDVLLVRVEDGFQIGVEAKLTLNAKVLCQVLGHDSPYLRGTGPDCHAVLVPAVGAQLGLAQIAAHLGIVVITAQPAKEETKYGTVMRRPFEPDLPSATHKAFLHHHDTDRRDWPELCPDKRCPLPDYVPDVIGGKSSPVQLTHWKVQAIKIAILIEERGYVTRADFKALKIDSSRWTKFWLNSLGEGKWGTGGEPNFKAQHPVNYEQIKADIEKWRPPASEGAPLLVGLG